MEPNTAPLETGLTIADAAKASGVSVHTLRYYERAGLIDGVDRAASGHRRYGELVWEGDGNERERLALLEEHRAAVRAQLAQVRTHLAFVERKIAIYEEKLDE
jgi:MerR family regulatory protein